MAFDSSTSRRTDRPLLPPRVLGLAIGVGGSAATALLWWVLAGAMGRDSLVPWLVLGAGLVVAWGLAVSFGMAAAARQRVSEGLEERQRLQAELAELAERARQAESLRRSPVAPASPISPAPPISPASPISPAPSDPSPPPAVSLVVPAQEPPLHESLRDPLTGLFHRRYFEASLGREIHRMERRNLSLGILLLQVDSFDTLVDIRGQESVDGVLRMVAELLRRRVRGGDVASHNGRGEFGLILPEAPLEGVQTRAEQLRTAVREMKARSGDEPPVSFTLSLGVAAYPDSGLTFDRLLRALKEALDQSRREGGDRVSVAPSAVLDRRLMLPD